MRKTAQWMELCRNFHRGVNGAIDIRLRRLSSKGMRHIQNRKA